MKYNQMFGRTLLATHMIHPLESILDFGIVLDFYPWIEAAAGLLYAVTVVVRDSVLEKQNYIRLLQEVRLQI